MAKKMIKKIKEYCGDCSAWSGTDCTRNPYAQGCLKEKIEEMAKDLYGHICGKVKCEDCKYHGDSEILSKYCDNYLRAKHLVEKGYRKIPKNAVVLTREEYEWLTCCFGKFEEIMNDIKEQSRKETAEKFAGNLKEKMREQEERYASENHRLEAKLPNLKYESDIPIVKEQADKSSGQATMASKVELYIDEICKEIVEGKI